MGWYRIVRQTTYPDGTVVEPDDVVDNVPEADIGWLLDAGAIVETEPPDGTPAETPKRRGRSPRVPEPEPEPEPVVAEAPVPVPVVEESAEA